MMEMSGYGRVSMTTIQSSSLWEKRCTPSPWRWVKWNEKVWWQFNKSMPGTDEPFIHRMGSWWRRAPTTRCRSTRFLTVIQTASWHGSLPTPRMWPLTAVGPEWLQDPGTKFRRGRFLSWQVFRSVQLSVPLFTLFSQVTYLKSNI